MQFYRYIITKKYLETEGTHIYHLQPKEGKVPERKPGQYVFLQDPQFDKPDELHPFSIASSPLQTEYLEFCIKVYGDWTESFSKRKVGDEVLVSEPQGVFTWDKTYPYAVFLLGGIGISPLMAMLRTIAERKEETKLVMIYGNRTPDTIAYEKELTALTKDLKHFKLVHVFSHLQDDYLWTGYRGFITKEIVEKEVELSKNPTFFFIGPPFFVDKMHDLMHELRVENSHIKTERLEVK